MARKLRFEEPDGIYHIGSRGNNGQMMFRDEIDRMEWLRLFAKVAVEYRWVGWTYVLMGNHFHFLADPARRPLAWDARAQHGLLGANQ